MYQKSWYHCYCYCGECNRFFVHPQALEQHRYALHTFICADCNRTYTTADGLKAHQKSKNHCYCGECDRFFVHSGALGQHLRSTIHATQFHCCDCDRDFVHERALQQHLASSIHEPRSRLTVSTFKLWNWVCEKCEIGFTDEKGLEQHRSSVIHNPLSNIICIGSRCKKRFTSPSALIHHLESGACPSKMIRDKLNSAVLSNDVNRLISGGSIQDYAVLAGPDVSETTSITDSIIYTPITEGSFDGLQSPSDTWEHRSGMLTPNLGDSQPLLSDLSLALRLTCPLCPADRKAFSSREALTKHLSSPAHLPKVYHCPFYFAGLEDDPQLMKYFSTLSGLMQHLESGACQGGESTFRKTVEYIEHQLGKMGYRKLRLLK